MSELALKVGVVAIGRNEGDRLKRCLASVIEQATAVVYVDSGSTDGSVDLAQFMGVEVVPLDLSVPFTAARARNAGAEHLIAAHPDIEAIQFVDGDCEMIEGYLAAASQRLSESPELAIVTGWRVEREPDASLFNLLCDIEWRQPAGEVTWVGGDFLIRKTVFEKVAGFDVSLIAGEEPDLCVRVRRESGKLERLPVEMTRHDAAMLHWKQWWRRTVRWGHAMAELNARYGQPPERMCVSEIRRVFVWAVVMPVFAIVLAYWTWGLSMLLWIAANVWRYTKVARAISKQRDARAGKAVGLDSVLGVFAQAQGMWIYWWRRWRGKQKTLIEYKSSNAAGEGSA